MCLLLALCGDKRNLEIREVPLSNSVQQDVVSAFLSQEETFRYNKTRGRQGSFSKHPAEERPFNEGWINDDDEIMTVLIPEKILVFMQIFNSIGTEFAPLDNGSLKKVRGLAIKHDNGAKRRILIQLFEARQSLSNSSWLISLFYQSGTYTRLESPIFCLGSKLVCIVEDDLIKFRSLRNLSRVIDTSAIFKVATDSDVKFFADRYSRLFGISSLNEFVDNTNQYARKCIMLLIKKGVLEGHTVQTLQEAAAKTQLTFDIRNEKIIIPNKRKDIMELMRFLNDGRYVGPISGNPLITNSKRSTISS